MVTTNISTNTGGVSSRDAQSSLPSAIGTSSTVYRSSCSTREDISRNLARLVWSIRAIYYACCQGKLLEQSQSITSRLCSFYTIVSATSRDSLAESAILTRVNHAVLVQRRRSSLRRCRSASESRLGHLITSMKAGLKHNNPRTKDCSQPAKSSRRERLLRDMHEPAGQPQWRCSVLTTETWHLIPKLIATAVTWLSA